MALLSGQRLLVVEDEYFIADDLVRCLMELGAEIVGPVPRLDHALAMAVSRHDLTGAVLDIALRGEVSYPVADELMRQRVPLVFATGYSARDLPYRFRSVPLWQKPLDVMAIAMSLLASQAEIEPN